MNISTNPFLNNYNRSSEQQLLDSLIVESIKMYGQDMHYLPRRESSYDGIYGEDDTKFFDTTYLMEFFIKSVDGFGGQGSFMSKFGLEIRDQVTLSVAMSRFDIEVTKKESHILRPREGDLIYFPLNRKIFEVKFVDKFQMFYPLGALYLWDVQCELFEYSNEKFETGIPEVDRLQKEYSFNAHDHAILTANDEYLTDESNGIIVQQTLNINIANTNPGADNDRIQEETAVETDDSLIVWDETSPLTKPINKRY